MTPLTREQIDSLRALLAKATPGPWPLPQPSRTGADLYSIGYGSPYLMVAKRQEDAELIAFLRNEASALLDIAEAVGWQPIESAPKARGPMIVVRGVFADRNYVTDPWCVFWQEGKWQRWPHDDPPTHWMPLPVLPLAGEVAGNG